MSIACALWNDATLWGQTLESRGDTMTTRFTLQSLYCPTYFYPIRPELPQDSIDMSLSTSNVTQCITIANWSKSSLEFMFPLVLRPASSAPCPRCKDSCESVSRVSICQVNEAEKSMHDKHCCRLTATMEEAEKLVLKLNRRYHF